MSRIEPLSSPSQSDIYVNEPRTLDTTGHWSGQQTGEKVNSRTNVLSEVLWQNKRFFLEIVASLFAHQTTSRVVAWTWFSPFNNGQIDSMFEVSLYIDFHHFLSQLWLLPGSSHVDESVVCALELHKKWKEIETRWSLKVRRESRCNRDFSTRICHVGLKWVSNDDAAPQIVTEFPSSKRHQDDAKRGLKWTWHVPFDDRRNKKEKRN